MKFWGSKVAAFLVVLAAVLLFAQTARRVSAHASNPVVETHTAAALNLPAIPPSPAAVPDTSEAAVPPQIVSPQTHPSIKSRATTSSGVTAAPARSPAALASGPGDVHTFHDRSYKISFDYPANWQFTDRDHEISTFRLDARSADKKTQLRAVTALPENPYPASTFTGAYVYLSVTPHSNLQKCSAQAAPTATTVKPETSKIAGLSFAHGHTEQKHICTVERDEVFTTYRKGSCYRFDLAMNNFCGGEVSGVKDVTAQELDNVLARMESIMGTVRFDSR